MQDLLAVKNYQKPNIENVGIYVFNFNSQTLVSENSVRRLTSKESKLLFLFCKYRNRLLDRHEALIRIWGNSDYFNRRSMDVYVSKLRKYLANDPGIRIENVHGKGYIMRVAD